MPRCKFAFADPPYGADVDKWDAEFYWEHDYLIEKSDVVAVTPGIVSIKEFMNKTQLPYRWSLACWIINGTARGEMGFGNWIYVALFSNESLYRNAQDFVKISIKSTEAENTGHKGQKPAGLLSYLLKTFTEEDDYIIDPFLGSGRTLIVADKLLRSCIGGEINPEYCSKIIDRWQNKTGFVAERIEVSDVINSLR